MILFMGICFGLSEIFGCQRPLHSVTAGEKPSYSHA